MKRFPILAVPAAAAVAMAAAGVGPVWADDWPDFRGPGRRGISGETGWRTDWTARPPAELWRVQVGVGRSSCTVVGDRVFTMGANRDGREAVICLNAETGREIWRNEIACPFSGGPGDGGPAATPVADGDRVYALSSAGDLRCLRAADGGELWSRHLERDFKGVRPRQGWASTPLVAGNMAIAETGGNGTSLLALDKLTGELMWHRGADPAGCSGPVVFRGPGLRGVAVVNGFGLTGIDPRNGAALFRHRRDAPPGADAILPLHDAGRFLVGGGRSVELVDVSGDEPETRWTRNAPLPGIQSGVLAGGSLFLVSGDADDRCRLDCLDFATGTLRWTRDVGTGGTGQVIVADTNLIVATGSGEVVLATADPARYREIARISALAGPVRSPPSLANGRLIIRNAAGTVVALDFRSGK